MIPSRTVDLSAEGRYLDEPSAKQEKFIVPLLGDHIAEALKSIISNLDFTNNIPMALDCGCADQPLRRMIETYGIQYQGLDIRQNSDCTVDYLIQLDSAPNDIAQAVQRKYDLVIATEVLEHVQDVKRAFLNMYSLTNDGGYVLITTPFFYPLHEEPHDFVRLTPHSIQALATDVGFSLVSLQRIGSASDVIGTVLGATTLRLKSSGSILDRIHSRAVLLVQRLAYSYLLRYRDRLVQSGDTIYLANIAILHKPPLSKALTSGEHQLH